MLPASFYVRSPSVVCLLQRAVSPKGGCMLLNVQRSFSWYTPIFLLIVVLCHGSVLGPALAASTVSVTFGSYNWHGRSFDAINKRKNLKLVVNNPPANTLRAVSQAVRKIPITGNPISAILNVLAVGSLSPMYPVVGYARAKGYKAKYKYDQRRKKMEILLIRS